MFSDHLPGILQNAGFRANTKPYIYLSSENDQGDGISILEDVTLVTNRHVGVLTLLIA